MSNKFENVAGGFRQLNDGRWMPMIGLGISRIVDETSLDVSVEAALKAGYRLFDTAHIYENEEQLGNSLKKYLPKFGLTRQDIFITTKLQITDGDTVGIGKKDLEESLQKLQTDYLDLVLMHYPRDRYTGVDDNYEGNKKSRQLGYQLLEEYQRNGKIRSIGVSNYLVYHLTELFEYAKVAPAVNQFEYHPYLTRPTLRHYCNLKGIFVQAYSSLCWGNTEILDAVKALADKYNVSPQTTLLAFALNGGVGIIPKSVTPERIASNLEKTANLKMTEAEMKHLYELDRNQAFCPGCQPWRCL